jgi:tripartite-type tricarboxylate transporter receptor subunit TctC
MGRLRGASVTRRGNDMLIRRQAVLLALAAMLTGAAALAQDWPSRPVRIIIGFGPGSTADVIARFLAPKLTQALGQQFIIETKPGAGSNLAADYVVRATDGHTVLMATVANTINATLSANIAFDFARDLAPVALVATVPNVLVVSPALGVKSVPELIALAKSKPEQIHFASSGGGTLAHLSGELLNHMAGIRLVHVPYAGSAQGLTDILAGRVGVMFSPANTVWPQVEAKNLIALATTQTRRSAMAPDLPTMAESGLPGYDSGIWFGMLAPAGTPRAIVERLSAAVNDALRAPEVLAPLRLQGIDPVGGSPDEFARYIESEIKRWAEVATAAGLKKN